MDLPSCRVLLVLDLQLNVVGPWIRLGTLGFESIIFFYNCLGFFFFFFFFYKFCYVAFF